VPRDFPPAHTTNAPKRKGQAASLRYVPFLRRGTATRRVSIPVISVATLGHAYAIAGRKPEAQNALDQLLDKSKKQYVSPFYVAIVYAGLNENEKALDWLEKAYDDRSNGIVFLKVDPQLDSLRSNPRFRSLLQRLALPD
jgi:hypothetical protein